MSYTNKFDDPDNIVWQEQDTDFDAIRKKYGHMTIEELDEIIEKFTEEILSRRAKEEAEK
ncbi:MAG: hypothetical protein II996_07370 [Oscillospiraceae bacterium]|nr:hypothetical protein [Oscillospiraceae bacterium]